ncbi:type I-F CRISPR-associated helicase Cas3 [Crenothrix sp. D3]|nr:type I-F CRISPR-associated helicase Cas3 [Crenothrix sp. D3]
MMVTFVCECEKKALDRTRRVLDAFANRIGSRTWQTVITEDGLDAVKKLLRKTASKNTAVSCHWIRSRSRSDLVWIIGDRSKFNAQGIVPVNFTQKDILKTQYDSNWHYLPLIKSLAALAALFHDWGKASEYFQAKLKSNTTTGDPLRHEWISVLFFNAYVNGETDEQWLNRLINAEFDVETLQQTACKNIKTPLHELPNAASVLAWLIVSHHRLPSIKSNQDKSAEDFKGVFRRIRQNWGYENSHDAVIFKKNLPRCFDYPKGLPSNSPSWLKECQKQASLLYQQLPLLEQAIKDGSWRLLLLHSRLVLMLGDHNYSSLKIDDVNRLKTRELALYANTDKDSNNQRVFKQTLDEHLLGVAKQARYSADSLPKMEKMNVNFDWAHDISALKSNSPAGFEWQDVAVQKIKQWLQKQTPIDRQHYGFFAVNMASTGKGKTFANAKIMRALSPNGESLRYVLALGLRTLTLQTGDEYRERIGLKANELAVLIGSRAILELHEQKQQDKQDAELEITGSESEETLLDNDLFFNGSIADDWLKTVLKTPKDRRFLYAPVLSCTIDHLMAATETQRGGRYILPTLRLMSSDLVIDEIDDFSGEDLIAIGRLIHLAGMLGRKVMISSATIPPDLAEGYYYAYQAGWSQFATMRQQSKRVGCAWIDDFTTQVITLESQQGTSAMVDYQTAHQKFVAKRNQALQKQPAKRKATIVDCSPEQALTHENIEDYFANVIQDAILEKHQQHHLIDEVTSKQVSFGVVRIANIKPCIALTRRLLNADWSNDTEIRAMAYHSQQVLIMRSEQEKHLDCVLKRTRSNSEHTLNNPQIRAHLNAISAKNVIFILVATPVEEVGRDHDFDWSVVEPSSYRSFIQLAGRIMRHREPTSELAASNMALLQYNLNGLKGKEVVFNRPGYESTANPLVTHDLKQLLDIEAIAKRLDATARITKPDTLQPKHKLVDLEHHSIQQLLTSYEKQGPESLSGWIASCWWLTGEPQQYVQFRRSAPMLTLFLIPEDDSFKFKEKDKWGEWIGKEKAYGIIHDEGLTTLEKQRLWLWRDYQSLLENSPKPNREEAAQAYGEANFPQYHNDINNLHFNYSSQFGLYEKT